MGRLPKSPNEIGTSFILHTRERSDSNSMEMLDPYDESSIVNSNFNSAHNTTVIVHGFHSTNTSEWIQPLVDALLANSEMNVIVVDWSGGAFDSYFQSVANTRVVGATIAELVTALHNISNIDYSTVHLIGHSLGSHICGYAGERIPNLGRITGLDPAGPLFNNMDPAVRIDSTDAVFVDVIHTDGTRYGLNMTVGDVDFYPNGGIHQPGCINDQIDPSISCSHVRAVNYFIESIKPSCYFKAFPCASFADFMNRKCITCEKGCEEMGYNVDHNAKGSYFLSTSWHYPFCTYKHFQNTHLA